MASVTLGEGWFHRSSDPATNLEFEEIQTLQVQGMADGRIAKTTEGRRWITTGTGGEDLTIQIEFAARTDIDTLMSWKGLPLVYRDATGRMVWGVITAMQETDSGGLDIDNVYGAVVTMKEIIGTVEV